MLIRMLIGVIASFLSLNALADGASLQGAWQSTWGAIQFTQVGDYFHGKYATDNGLLMGRIEGNTMHGYWIEDAAGTRCDTPQDGRYYWGHVQLTVAADGKSFAGSWGYCDGPTNQGDWTGSR